MPKKKGDYGGFELTDEDEDVLDLMALCLGGLCASKTEATPEGFARMALAGAKRAIEVLDDVDLDDNEDAEEAYERLFIETLKGVFTTLVENLDDVPHAIDFAKQTTDAAFSVFVRSVDAGESN